MSVPREKSIRAFINTGGLLALLALLPALATKSLETETRRL